ncbi:DNA-binding beta-propeller fold protein YncE [Granulicella aggregans]|uniref:DNA-binding beta-propeller fold protein YncE n=2 Tax=Granulicella aggregans TaxID=474949 RepID=A0A7W7ZGE2_9BACT|nr:DNA-binding beta-propeller fold protein YncE [Granulicella aggregans]
MNRSIRRGLQITAALAAAVLVCLSIVVPYLAYPGTPSKSNFMTFEGYVELPKHGLLNVLDYMALSGKTLFVTSESTGSLFKIDLNPDRLSVSPVAEMPGAGAAHGMALFPDANVAFLTRSEENIVQVFDPKTLEQFQSIPVADDADAILYVPSARLVYVANGGPKMATLIDPERRVTVGTISLPGEPEFVAQDPQTGLLYQNLQDLNSLAGIDLGSRSIVGRWPLDPCERPTGMAIDPSTRRLFAVCAGNALLVVFDLDQHRVITSLKIGGGPDSVAFDPILHRVYSAGKDGKLTVIHQDGPDAYRVLDEIRTHYGAHTLAVDPISHKVYVGYASLLVRPRIAVFSPTRGEDKPQ